MKAIRKVVNFDVDLRKKSFTHSEKIKISKTYNYIIANRHLKIIKLRHKPQETDKKYNIRLKKFKENYDQKSSNINGVVISHPFKTYTIDKNYNIKGGKKDNREYITIPFPKIRYNEWDFEIPDYGNIELLVRDKIYTNIIQYNTLNLKIESVRIGLNLGLSGETYILGDISDLEHIVDDMLEYINNIMEKYEVSYADIVRQILIKRRNKNA